MWGVSIVSGDDIRKFSFDTENLTQGFLLLFFTFTVTVVGCLTRNSVKGKGLFRLLVCGCCLSWRESKPLGAALACGRIVWLLAYTCAKQKTGNRASGPSGPSGPSRPIHQSPASSSKASPPNISTAYQTPASADRVFNTPAWETFHTPKVTLPRSTAYSLYRLNFSCHSNALGSVSKPWWLPTRTSLPVGISLLATCPPVAEAPGIKKQSSCSLHSQLPLSSQSSEHQNAPRAVGGKGSFSSAVSDSVPTIHTQLYHEAKLSSHKPGDGADFIALTTVRSEPFPDGSNMGMRGKNRSWLFFFNRFFHLKFWEESPLIKPYFCWDLYLPWNWELLFVWRFFVL